MTTMSAANLDVDQAIAQLAQEGYVVVEKAGSMAIWLSNTWHCSGPNYTDQPRRAILTYYARSWVKPFNDFRVTVPHDLARTFSPTVRYLLGFSANAIPRY